MWNSRELLGGLTDKGTPGGGNMAHRKSLISMRMGTLITLGVIFSLLMAGRVVLLNQVTNMRVQNAHLQDRQTFLETRRAALQAQLNQVTRPEVICARASRELGLIQPEVPDPVLVRLPRDRPERRWRLPGWLPALAGGEDAHAQGMIRLQPGGGATGGGRP
jgi:cell division protein FtsB